MYAVCNIESYSKKKLIKNTPQVAEREEDRELGKYLRNK